MKKSLLLIAVIVAALGLSACNGGSSQSAAGADVQVFTGSTTNVGESFVAIAGEAYECRAISSGGTCTVDIGYYTQSGSPFIGESIGFVSVPAGYTTNIATTANCPAVESTINSCTVTITNTTANVDVAVPFTISVGVTPTDASFNVGSIL